MTTIAKTANYHELHLGLLKLMQLYAVVSELRLHTNLGVNEITARYYYSKLFAWSEYGSFLAASQEAMLQVFYIELSGYIGAFWNLKTESVKRRDYDSGSLGQYLYENKQTKRKKTALAAFESLLKEKEPEIAMIYVLRGNLAHFTKTKQRNGVFVPNDIQVREILDKLAEIIHLLGFQRWNKPDYFEHDNKYTTSTQKVIDSLVRDDKEANHMRKLYLSARSKWFKSK
jgi:hypothetical protein